ncbi:hypothetical protein COCON_G00193470 [Conger conger]|uniref:G-protein coupled receptors family 1 profile domain-containing protein n=1 Tax=Conger conger TaxID=82655 RepID=A0A9Q1HQ42_CONCO|nr:hypothetical protein COCON_G00193470 [Conger conger]
MTATKKIVFVADFDDLYGDLFTAVANDSIEIDLETVVCEIPPLHSAVYTIMCTFYILIFLMALPGNLLVGLVIQSCRQTLSPSDIYLFHLAVADTLLALTLPFRAASLMQGWVFGDAACKLFNLVLEVTFYSSVLFLVCISVDRYLVIVRAMETRKERRRLWSWGVCGGVWVAGAALSLPALYSRAVAPPGQGREECTLHAGDPENASLNRLVMRVLRHTLGFLLPLAAMLGCYGPYHLSAMADTLMRFQLVERSCRARQAVDSALFATQSLGLVHCCINPVLYAFIGEKFRRNLLLLCHRTGALERTSASRYSRSTSHTSEASSPVM